MIEFTIPPAPYEVTDERSLFIPNMEGPLNSFAFSHRVLANALLPILLFYPSLNNYLQTKSALAIAKKYQSLAWALRAWCHKHHYGFGFMPDGETLEILERRDAYETNAPITRAQYMKFGGWCLVQINALVFDWDKIDALKSFHHKGAFLSICRNDESSPTGYADVVTLPDINYNGNLLEQMQCAIDNLNEITLDLTRHYNTN